MSPGGGGSGEGRGCPIPPALRRHFRALRAPRRLLPLGLTPDLTPSPRSRGNISRVLPRKAEAAPGEHKEPSAPTPALPPVALPPRRSATWRSPPASCAAPPPS